MKFQFGISRSVKEANDLLTSQNKSLNEEIIKLNQQIEALERENNALSGVNNDLEQALFPLTKLGFQISNIPEILEPIAALLKEELDKVKEKEMKYHFDNSFHSRGNSDAAMLSTPPRNNPFGF
jgi:cell division protein FtsB